jgi:hypothetical protein
MLGQPVNSTTSGPEQNVVQKTKDKVVPICQRKHGNKQQLIPSISAQETCSLSITESCNAYLIGIFDKNPKTSLFPPKGCTQYNVVTFNPLPQG